MIRESNKISYYKLTHKNEEKKLDSAPLQKHLILARLSPLCASIFQFIIHNFILYVAIMHPFYFVVLHKRGNYTCSESMDLRINVSFFF